MTTGQHRSGFVDYWPPAGILAAMVSASWARSGRTVGRLLSYFAGREFLSSWTAVETATVTGGGVCGTNIKRWRHWLLTDWRTACCACLRNAAMRHPACQKGAKTIS
jgi:hypothetical protein